MEIKVGDTVKASASGDELWVVLKLKGHNPIFKEDLECRSLNDGEIGLIPESHLTKMTNRSSK